MFCWEDDRIAYLYSRIRIVGSQSISARFRTSRFKNVHRTTVLTRSRAFFRLTTWQLCPQVWNPGEVYRTESNEEHVRQLVATSRLLLRVCVYLCVYLFYFFYQITCTNLAKQYRWFRVDYSILYIYTCQSSYVLKILAIARNKSRWNNALLSQKMWNFPVVWYRYLNRKKDYTKQEIIRSIRSFHDTTLLRNSMKIAINNRINATNDAHASTRVKRSSLCRCFDVAGKRIQLINIVYYFQSNKVPAIDVQYVFLNAVTPVCANERTRIRRRLRFEYIFELQIFHKDEIVVSMISYSCQVERSFSNKIRATRALTGQTGVTRIAMKNSRFYSSRSYTNCTRYVAQYSLVM